MTALLQRIVDFPTRVFSLSNSAPSTTLTVVETAKLTPALIEMLNERGAMRITVSQ